jgi:hypothetical protein
MKNSTYIALILDRSGSIESCLAQMQSALDEFVNVQKKEPGECEFLLVQFDNVYDVVYSGPIGRAPRHVIAPRGSTALHDAMAQTIDELGASLARRPEHERPERVLVCTITDGLENASHRDNAKTVGDRIKLQREQYKWNFVFLGANQDAVLVAQTLNIPTNSAMTYGANTRGLVATAGSLNSYTASFRNAPTLDIANNVSFSEEERSKALGQDDPIITSTTSGS